MMDTNRLLKAHSLKPKTLKHIRWFEVVKHSGAIDNSSITEYQAEVDFAFKVERG